MKPAIGDTVPPRPLGPRFQVSLKQLLILVVGLGLLPSGCQCLIHAFDDIDAVEEAGSPGAIEIRAFRVSIPISMDKRGGWNLYLTNRSGHELTHCKLVLDGVDELPFRDILVKKRKFGEFLPRADSALRPGEQIYVPFNYDQGQVIPKGSVLSLPRTISIVADQGTWRWALRVKE